MLEAAGALVSCGLEVLRSFSSEARGDFLLKATTTRGFDSSI